MDNNNTTPDIQQTLSELKVTLIKVAEDTATASAEKVVKPAAELITKINSVEADVKVIKDASDKNQEALDKLIKQAGERHLNPEHFNKNSFQAELLKGLNAQRDALKAYKDTRQQITIDLKVVGDMGGGNFTVTPTTARFGDSTFLGSAALPFNKNHMRNIIPTAPVSGDSVYVIRDNGGEGGPTGVQPGALKPQSDRDFQKVIVPVTKIAHWYRIPEEWLEDTAWLANDIAQIGTEELLKIEDAKILSNNTANEFWGLVQNSTAFAAPADLALKVKTPNNHDVLVAAWTQARNLNENPNYHVVGPGSYAAMLLSKSTTGEYAFGANMAIPTAAGVPIVAISAMNTLGDKFFTMDTNLSTIGIRKGVQVRFYDQDQDNAIKNMVTVVIEERITLVVRRLTSVIYGDFSDAITALTAP